MLSFVTILILSVLCYLIGWGCKLSNAIRDNFIPLIVLGFGAVIGLLGKVLIPAFPVPDLGDGCAVGLVAGALAIAVNQVYKQLVIKK